MMLGIGPILWHEANRLMHNNPKASGAEPVDRLEAWIYEDIGTSIPKYRYRSPAAWWYYQKLDEINARIAAAPEPWEDGTPTAIDYDNDCAP